MRTLSDTISDSNRNAVRRVSVRMYRHVKAGTLTTLALLVPSPPALAFNPPDRSVVITRGQQGVPHITAPNYEKLAYGLAWTLAEDNLCEVAFNRLKVRGELAQTFGPKPPKAFGKNSFKNDNVASDFYYRLLHHRGFPGRGLTGPRAPSRRAWASVRGFVRGYNDFLKHHRDSDPRCAGETWLKPLTKREVWLFAHSYDDWEFDFRERLNANPPEGPGSLISAFPAATAVTANLAGSVSEHSQALAFGAQVTGGGAIVAYDPHTREDDLSGFARITIPGRLDVFGHRLRFSPALYAGANANFSWTLTASHQQRRTFRRLTLMPGSPTSYVIDGKTIAMGHDRVTVTVKEADGTLSRRSKTFYTTVWGDVLVRGDGSQVTDLPWTRETAYSSDEGAINATSQRLFDYHIDINRAQSFADLRKLVFRWGGFLDSHITGADTSGQAFFFGPAGVPNIDFQRQERCINTVRAKKILEVTGEPVLDGSTKQCVLPDQAGAFRPGTVGVTGIPQLQDRLYTFNANNSHWLVTQSNRLEGFNPFFTNPSRAERRPISPRARLILSIAEELVRHAEGSGRPIDVKDVARAFLTPRDFRAVYDLERVISWCRGRDSVPATDGASVPIAEACDVLGRWDRRHQMDSRGGTLWRLFWAKLADRFEEGTLPVSTPAYAKDPLSTPGGLRFTPEVATAFADAIQAIRRKGLPLDVPVGDALRFVRSGTVGPEFPGRGCFDRLLGCNIINQLKMDQVFVQTDGSGTNAAFIAQLHPGKAAAVEYYSPLQVRNPSSPWYDTNIAGYYSTMRTSTLWVLQPRTKKWTNRGR